MESYRLSLKNDEKSQIFMKNYDKTQNVIEHSLDSDDEDDGTRIRDFKDNKARQVGAETFFLWGV